MLGAIFFLCAVVQTELPPAIRLPPTLISCLDFNEKTSQLRGRGPRMIWDKRFSGQPITFIYLFIYFYLFFWRGRLSIIFKSLRQKWQNDKVTKLKRSVTAVHRLSTGGAEGRGEGCGGGGLSGQRPEGSPLGRDFKGLRRLGVVCHMQIWLQLNVFIFGPFLFE